MAGITAETRRFNWRKMLHSKIDRRWPRSLFFPSGILVGSRIYVCGTTSAMCYCLDIETQKWRSIEVVGFRNSGTQHVLVDDCILCISSYNGENVVEVLDVVANVCTEYPIAFPRGTLEKNFTADYIEFIRQIAVFGGSVTSIDTSQLCFVDADTLEVKAPMVSGTSPSPRNGHTSCVVNDSNRATVFVYGGRGAGEYYHDLHLLHCHPDYFRWSHTPENTLAKSVYSSLTYIAGKLFRYGGFDVQRGDLAEFDIYELESKTWHELGSTGKYRVRGNIDETSAHCAVNSRNGLFFIGGFCARAFPYTYVLTAED